MNKKVSGFSLVFVFGLCLSVLAGYVWAQESGNPKALFENKCSQCHSFTRALNKPKSPEEWKATAKRMAQKGGSNISAQEADQIAEYLSSLKKD